MFSLDIIDLARDHLPETLFLIGIFIYLGYTILQFQRARQEVRVAEVALARVDPEQAERMDKSLFHGPLTWKQVALVLVILLCGAVTILVVGYCFYPHA